MNLKSGLVAIMFFVLVIPLLASGNAYAQPQAVPVPNAQVTLNLPDGSSLTLTTNSSGEVTALVRSGTYASISVSGVTILDKIMNNVLIDSSHNVVDIPVARAPWITGTLSVGNSPAPGIQVSSKSSVTSDANGRYAVTVGNRSVENINYMPLDPMMLEYFSLYNNLTGYSMINKINLPFNMITSSPSQIGNVLSKDESFDMAPHFGQELINHDVSLDASVTLSGTVTGPGGAPVNEALVSVYSNSSGLYGYAVTDSNGHYSITTNIKNGDVYSVRVVAYGYALFQGTVTISGDTTYNVQLQNAVLIKGHVTDGNGAPLSNIEILAMSSNGWASYALTDSNGYYELPTGFMPGDNVTINFGDRDAVNSVGFYAYKVYQFITAPGTNVVDLVYDLPLTTITGVVDDADRSGLLENPTIMVTPHANVPAPLPSFNVMVSGNGSFVIKFPWQISYSGFNLTITTVDISVRSNYYYPAATVAVGVNAQQDSNLGVISIHSYPLIQATIKVHTTKSNVTLPDFVHHVTMEYNGMEFHLSVETNSSLSGVMAFVAPNNGTIGLYVLGPDGTSGYLRLAIPKSFLAPPYNIYLDGSPKTFNVVSENATHVVIEIFYTHSEHFIMVNSSSVIPEFPLDILSITTLLIVTILVTLLLRKRFL